MNTMMRLGIVALLWLLYGVLAEAEDLRLLDLVPKGALNVETRQVSEADARADQLVFVRHTRLRASPLDDLLLQRLKGDGWKKCESPLSKWGAYLDGTKEPAAEVVSRFEFFVRNHEYLQIAAVFRIEQSTSGVGSTDILPQTVSITHATFSSPSAAASRLARLDVSCPR